MATIECKNCGAAVTLPAGQATGTCEYCGSIMTLSETETEQIANTANVHSLLKRIELFLEDGKWDNAKEYCEKVLDINPECAQAYLYRLMSNLKVHKTQKLITRNREIMEMDDYQKAFRFGTPEFQKMLEELSLDNRYYLAQRIMDTAQTKAQYKSAAVKFKKISNWKDADKQREKCLELAEITGKDTAYNEASTLMKEADLNITFVNGADRIVKLENAIELFTTIPGWKDANSLKSECERILELSIEKRKTDELQRLKSTKRKNIITISALIIISIFIFTLIIIPTFKQRKEQIALETIEKDKLNYSYEQRLKFLKNMPSKTSIAAGNSHTVGLKKDGTVVATGDNTFNQCNVEDWNDIISITAGSRHTVGLKKDGTVVATGENEFNQCDVKNWNDIVSVAAGIRHTVGLKKDGTVVATGREKYGACNVSNWHNIMAIITTNNGTIGIHSDGSIVTTGKIATEWFTTEEWNNIVILIDSFDNAIGLKSDGTVIEAKNTDTHYPFYVNDWNNIIAVSAGFDYAVGLKSDGTVVATGSFDTDLHKQNFDNWENIIAISISFQHTIGLKSDGTVVATGDNNDGQCDVSTWTDIRIP